MATNLIEPNTVEVSRLPRLEVTIRPAVPSDITGIKLIADRNKRALGFVVAGALTKAVERGFVVVAEAEGQVVGFCEFYLYKDGTQVSIYTLATAEEWRKLGIARRLVYTVCELAPLTQLKCVADLPANKFYRGLGFTCVRTEAGKRRRLNVWQYRQCQCGRCQRDRSGWPAGVCHWCGEDTDYEAGEEEDTDEAICTECWHKEYGDEDDGDEDE